MSFRHQFRCYFMKFAFLFTALVALAGCTNHQQALQATSAGFKGTFREYQSGPLPVKAWLPAGQHKHLRVFIEGDGHAFVTASRASADPTPSDPVILRLALHDGAAYLARPCQYVTNSHCRPVEWTDRRFSSEALASMTAALDDLKARAGAASMELVGYSGGGAMALLLAATRDDVDYVQTIAGNVSPTYWATSKGFTPLTGSLDPLIYRDRLARIPQRHLVGDRDKVISRAVVDNYREALPSQELVEVVIYSGDHWSGIETAWRQLGRDSK